MRKRVIRLPPLSADKWGEDEKSALASFVNAKPAGAKSLQSKTDEKSRDLTALELFLNHPNLAKAYLPYAQFILHGSELGFRERELLVLRIGWLRSSEYEWGQHVLMCQSGDIPDEIIRRVTLGADAPEWDEQDRFLMIAADELVANACLSQSTWDGLSKYFDTHKMLEILFIVGTYDMIAMIFNSTGVPLNDNLQAVLKDFPLPE